MPRHKYLFKIPNGWQERQIWSELIAYELSRPLNVQVPACFLAIDQNTNETGVLIEFFYGYENEPKSRFVPGSDYIHAWYANLYNRKRGRPHLIGNNITIARVQGVTRPKDWWVRTLLFDALIGNVDRHGDNWGFVAVLQNGDHYELSMAPLFDNGTSLEYGKPDNLLHRIANDLDGYIHRGRHHCSWDSNDPKGTLHMELCSRFCETYDTVTSSRDFLSPLSNYAIDSVLDWCVGFDSQVPFNEERAEFLSALLRRRRDLLLMIGADDG